MEKLKALFVQAVKFGLVGVINTLVDYLSYTLLLFIPFFAENYVLAQIIGYSLGLCNSLVLNLAALAVSTGILVLTQERMQMNRYIGKAISVVGSMAVNFVGNKLLVFREQRG